MKFKDLTQFDKDMFISAYENNQSREEIQKKIAKKFNIHTRTVRKWAKKLGVGLMKNNIVNPSKILVYDIETSRVKAKIWWSGKQYVAGNQLVEQPKIITVAWKWLGDSEVHYLTWDSKQNDYDLMRRFLKVYNKADMVIGQNNDNFDNRWINARAMIHGLEVNTYVKSFDMMKECKRLFRLPSYSLASLCELLDVTLKQSHEGLVMWDKIQDGTKEEQKEYLQKMVDYNIGDIVSTEEAYMKLRPYMGHKVHFGVLHGNEKYTCPDCGGSNVKFYKRTITPAGTVQIIMQCNDDKVKYKITNKQYMNFLDFKMKTNERKNM